MNYSELNDPTINQNIFNNQGMEYINFRNKKKQMDGKILSTNNDNNNSVNGSLEGFSDMTQGNAVDIKDSTEFESLKKLQEDYQMELSNYEKTFNTLNYKRNQYKKIQDSIYINKNIRLPNGQIGYVSEEGVFKRYNNWDLYKKTKGKNGCPADFINVNAKNTGYRILFNDKELPDFKLGSDMVMEQSCGFEGKNVFVTDSGPIGVSNYEGCYNNSSSSGLTKSGKQVPYNEEGFKQCKQYAHDTGNNVFAISRDGDNMNCYVGNDLYKVKSGGLAIIPIQSWASGQVNGDVATLNAAGQLLIQGSTTSQSNIVNGLQCNVYQGYMQDNPQYFKTAKTLNANHLNVYNFTNISTATNNLFPGNTPSSVEWIGYIKATTSGNWTFSLNSDDCSYMWIGSTAVTEYNRDNAFINNGGLHPPKVISRSVALTANQYYPIRIQFGQNEGGFKFDLKIQRPDKSETYDSREIFFSTSDTFNIPLYPNTGDSLETLWKSSEPQGSCHETYGGKINLTDSVSSWGYNCNAQNADAWGKSASYSVPLGNMNDEVMNNVNNKVYGTVIVGNGMNDVAYGCAKNFSSTYRCGNGQIKNKYMKNEASGRNANYNCNKENALCTFKLVVQDDGNLVIYGNDYNLSTGKYSQKPVWDSKTYNKTDKVDEGKNAEKSKYGRHYLLSGETLKDGEFIGSPSGKCFLKMTKGIGLQLFYNKINCSPDNNNNTNVTRLPNSNSPSSETLTVYSLPIAKGIESIGSISYINSDSKRIDFPQNMIEKGITYFNLGNFNNPDSKNIKTFEADTHKMCEEECNKMDNCEGFVFGGNKCYLKDADMYPNTYRYATPDVELYKRSVNIKNGNSCKKYVSNIDSQRLDSYVKSDNDLMSENQVCGLENHTINEQKTLGAIVNRLNDLSNKLNTKISLLSDNEQKMLNDYGINNDKIKDSILKINISSQQNKAGIEGFAGQTETIKTPGERFINTTQELSELQKQYSNSKLKITNLHGMETTSQKELIHNNYNYMLWSILAVIVVIGGMRILKK